VVSVQVTKLQWLTLSLLIAQKLLKLLSNQFVYLRKPSNMLGFFVPAKSLISPD
jgi:hypothetical protein